MIKQYFWAVLTASILLISGLNNASAVEAADDITLPDTLTVKGLVLNGSKGAIEEQKADLTLLKSIQFGDNKPLLVANNTILERQRVIKNKEEKQMAIKKTLLPKNILVVSTVATQVVEPYNSPTEVPTPSVVVPPTFTPQPQPTSTPAPQSSTGLDAEKLFTLANNHRKSLGLNELQKDERACALASSRAPEIAGEIAGGTMHAGVRARNLPYWNSENIITMGSEESAFNWWINDKIHKDAIEGPYTFSCVACSGYACVQEFTNFQSK